MSSSSTVDRVVLPISDVVSQQADWSALPEELLVLIFLHLQYAADIIHIRAVCRKWRYVSNTLRHKSLCPSLLLDSGRYGAFYDLFDFSKNKIQVFQLYPTDQILSKQARNGRFTNSCNGWLVRMDDFPLSWPIHIINPFTREQIQLPPASTFEKDPLRAQLVLNFASKRCFLRKAVLSSMPLDPKCVVVAIYSVDAIHGRDTELKLAFCSPRDTTWKAITSDQAKDFFVDVIYFKGHFYALGRSKELFRCDINSDDEPKAVRISLPEPLLDSEPLLGPEPLLDLGLEPEMMMWRELEWTRLGPRGRRSRPYLVDWCGDLLMVVRYTVFNKIFMSKTASFKVLKFDFGRGRWDEIDNLGGDGGSIFVSYSAMAVLSIKEEFPQFKSNCIYFTDDNLAKGWDNLRDTGVFCLSTKVCKPWRVLAGIWPPPYLWISPDLRTSG